MTLFETALLQYEEAAIALTKWPDGKEKDCAKLQRRYNDKRDALIEYVDGLSAIIDKATGRKP